MDKIYTEELYISKKERIGIIVLCFILFLSTIIPFVLNKQKKNITYSETSQNYATSVNHSFEEPTNSTKIKPPRTTNKINNKRQSNYFKFNPNTLNSEQAEQLGISKKVFKTLEKFRSKGFKFRKPEDLKKVYGLSEYEFNTLLPYVEIQISKNDSSNTKSINSLSSPLSHEIPPVEINIATREEWINLPGIGEKLADRIIKFKNNLGGFYDVRQIKEVYGIVDSTYLKIFPLLKCNPSISKLHLNSSDFDEINQHPYFDYKQAQFIINYRRQHDRINSLEDLIKTNYFSEEWIKKVEIYLSFE